MESRPAVGAIIVAAGSSSRMSGTDKLWIDLGGQPLLARTIAAISALAGLTQLVVVAGTETRRRAESLPEHEPWSRVHAWVAGGATRQDSVYCGLQALGPCDIVLVHDGARPLVTQATLARGVAAALAHGAAIAAVPVTDTIKAVDPQGQITATPDRTSLRAAQTPQVFREPLIRAAYAQVGAARAGCTDDAGVLELARMPVYTFAGERTNIKVSTPADIVVVRALWAARAEGAME